MGAKTRDLEYCIAAALTNWLRWQYPDVMFHWDFGSGVPLPLGLAMKQKVLNPERGWPDLFIAQSTFFTRAPSKHLNYGKVEILGYDGDVGGVTIKGRQTYKRIMIRRVPDDADQILYFRAGLFIELKKNGEKIYKKDGELVADEHIREQAAVLEKLRGLGYVAEFAVGLDEAKKIIEEYLGERDSKTKSAIRKKDRV